VKYSNEQTSDKQATPNPVLVAAFYKFIPLPDYPELRQPLQGHCKALGILGTILLASEGINGTISGSRENVQEFFRLIREDSRLADLQYKESFVSEAPFYRMKVRLKKEIVSLGIEGVDPTEEVGVYISPEDWNELVSRPGLRLIDTRNDYETHLGSFEGAEDPQTQNFRQFPKWVDENLDPERDTQVAMFCTGGIRCEKATAYLKQQGFANVYHLDGGILNYLEKIDASESKWQGDCFVFDNRVTVDHQLRQGDFEVCPACRMPVTEQDRQSPMFELHVSCPKCIHRLTPEKREGYLERAKQIALSKARGEKHFGSR
jgi:UPF0176 protein